MTKPSIRPEYDVVVIGAGISGLTSAALISRTGLSVGVFEMDSRPGGYLAGFRRKDFRFDSAIHWLNQCGPKGLVTRVFDFIGNDHPTALSQPNIKRYQGDNYDYLLTDKPDDLKAEFIQLFPHEKEGIEVRIGIPQTYPIYRTGRNSKRPETLFQRPRIAEDLWLRRRTSLLFGTHRLGVLWRLSKSTERRKSGFPGVVGVCD